MIQRFSVPFQAGAFSERGKGTYTLLLRLVAPSTVQIGSLGSFHLFAGWYAYVGSAYGSGGLRGRLHHHLSPVKKPHWHIDYLRQAASIEEIWYTVSETVYEHLWADALRSLPSAAIPIPRFGASDCKCQTHLIYFLEKPIIDCVPLLPMPPTSLSTIRSSAY